MSDYPTAVFSTFAFIGFTISLIPLPWHLEAWNSGTCYYMIWTSVGCLNQFINSVVWADDAINRAPVWCDISTRITLGVSVGIPASSLCIQRRLYKIACMQTVSISRAEKRRAILVDSLVSVLLPVIVMALYYVVQGHRFDIFQEVGCYPVVYDTLPSYFLINMWPVLLGCISAVYCILCIHVFLQRQVQFKEFLSASKGITMGRYLRLMALAMTEMLCTVPIGCYMIYLNASAQNVRPWKGWADTHYDFSRVDQFPSVVWRMYHRSAVSIELTRWLLPVCAIIFFAFFGFASEARRHYALVFWWVAKRFGFQRPASKPKAYAMFLPCFCLPC
ncbi:STE3-like pheromone receptor [Neolentinus lepideus HHB14362 ss-1]|uniref:STE3-like pheromone receptor n=1 Tax=Neolentinus lepideus HHB14362 ss-1 TaxID=1314782 RepID=A0A165NFW9_9AGAM|nr:STE3-like pheromone receptor [Neolentinus lepideus HHB14362 ss-1]